MQPGGRLCEGEALSLAKSSEYARRMDSSDPLLCGACILVRRTCLTVSKTPAQTQRMQADSHPTLVSRTLQVLSRMDASCCTAEEGCVVPCLTAPHSVRYVVPCFTAPQSRRILRRVNTSGPQTYGGRNKIFSFRASSEVLISMCGRARASALLLATVARAFAVFGDRMEENVHECGPTWEVSER
jgi:hypothetical protein